MNTILSQKQELKTLERKISAAHRSNTFLQSLSISSGQELDYLMSGHATELVETCNIPHIYLRDTNAKIYGVVANNRSNGRYVWLYLHYSHHLWRCSSLKEAYEIIEKLHTHSDMVKKAYLLEHKIRLEEKRFAKRMIA